MNKPSGSILTLSAPLKLLLGPPSTRRYCLDTSGRKEGLLLSHHPCHEPQLLHSRCSFILSKSPPPPLPLSYPKFDLLIFCLFLIQRGLGEGEVGWVKRLPFLTKMAAFVHRQISVHPSLISQDPGVDQLLLLHPSRGHPGGTGILGTDPGDHSALPGRQFCSCSI